VSERTPPHNDDAERAVLGAMLQSRRAIAEVSEVLTGRDFYKPAHETIYGAILDLYADGQPADALTAGERLEKDGELTRIGGLPYLHTLTSSVTTAASATWHADIVLNHAVRRRMIEVGVRIAQMGWDTDQGSDLPTIVDRAQAETHALSAPGRTGEAPSNLDVLDQLLDEIEHGTQPGLPTGFADLDSLTGGLHPGQMVIVAARPAIGKSTLGLDIARHVSVKHQLRSAIFSLEMGRKDLIRRAISAEARVPLHHLAPNAMTDDDWQRVAGARERVTTAPMVIDDSPHLTVMGIRTKARRLMQQGGLSLIVVDYLQLMSSGGSRRFETRQTEVSVMSRGMKLLAKELHIPVVVLAQLNRGPEQRSDKRPMLSDLRESGALEQDADLVILLHREDAYDPQSSRAGEADLIVAKHRNGPTATITVAFQGHYSRFVDMARS
jgi:replicative DNA helicase